MGKLKFFWDKSGTAHADATNKREQELVWFLEDDVQASSWACQEILRHIDAVASGREAEWAGTGNAHTLILTPQKAILENEYVEPQLTYELPLEEFRQLLQEYLVFVETGHSRQVSA